VILYRAPACAISRIKKVASSLVIFGAVTRRRSPAKRYSIFVLVVEYNRIGWSRVVWSVYSYVKHKITYRVRSQMIHKLKGCDVRYVTSVLYLSLGLLDVSAFLLPKREDTPGFSEVFKEIDSFEGVIALECVVSSIRNLGSHSYYREELTLKSDSLSDFAKIIGRARKLADDTSRIRFISGYSVARWYSDAYLSTKGLSLLVRLSNF